MTEDILKILAVLQAGTLISILVYGYKVIRFFNNIEFKTDMMWSDFERRMNEAGKGFYHRRSTDDNLENNGVQ